MIASGFQHGRVAESRPASAARRPETIRMDEEDGKTGARARQSGQLNASAGVPAQSLCLSPILFRHPLHVECTQSSRILKPAETGLVRADLPKIRYRSEENTP